VTTASASTLVLVDIPRAVVDHAKTGSFGTDFVGQGNRGRLMLDLEEFLRNVESGFGVLGSTFQLMQNEIRSARLQIERAKLEDKQRQLVLALQRLDNNRSMAIAEARRVAALAKGAFAIGATVTGVLSNKEALMALGFIAAPATGGGRFIAHLDGQLHGCQRRLSGPGDRGRYSRSRERSRHHERIRTAH
jgi:hypothetical protein